MVPILSVITMLLVGTFLIISDDSATFILGMQTSHDSLTPTGRKSHWGLIALTDRIRFIIIKWWRRLRRITMSGDYFSVTL